MKSILSAIIGLFIVALALQASFRVMNAMLIHENAHVVLDPEHCPIDKTADGHCVMTGDVGHNLYGDTTIKLQDGSTLIVPQNRVRMTAYTGGSSRYEPFGEAAAFVIGLSILLGGVVLAFGIPVVRLRRPTTH